MPYRAQTDSDTEPMGEPIDPEPGRLERIPGDGAGNGQVSGIERAADGAINLGIRVASPFVRLGFRTAREVGKRLGVNPAVERQVNRALESDAAGRTTQKVLETDAANQVWDKVLESEQAQKLVERVAEAPEVRSAITSQGVGLLEDLRRGARAVARRLDTGVERFARRLLRRRVRESRPPQAGAVTRGAALLLDWAIVYGVLLLISAAIALVVSAIDTGGQSAGTAAVAFGSLIWVISGAAYLSFFWAAVGRTPGMAFLGLRVAAVERRRIGPGQAIRRVIWFNISLLLFIFGFWGILYEERRRGWPDRRAHTVVLYADPELDAELEGWSPPPGRPAPLPWQR